MARTTTGRLTLRGELVARTALHVGGHGEDVDTDLPLARDGAGRWYVPGTSLAGALRGWCEAAFGEEETRKVWGSQEGDEGYASYVFVEDTAIAEADGVLAEIRDGVGIDREWGCAAEQIKHDRAVLPRGTRLSLEVMAEYGEGQRQPALAMFSALRKALEAEDIRLGAARTRGLGKLKLEKGRLRTVALNTRDGILALLSGESSDPVVPEDVSVHPRPRLEVEVEWQPVGPLMVKSGAEGIGVDALPLVSGTRGQVALVLPGSSTKGALRGQAERIVRTLRDVRLPEEPNKKKRFLRHLEGVPLIEEVFGAPGKSGGQAGGLGLGALGIDDCYAEQSIDRLRWEAVVEAGAEAPRGTREAPVCERLREANLGQWAAAYHVAVDRWTGGAAESLLYTVLEPHAVEWEPLRLTLDLTRLAEDVRPPAAALLLLLLRDLAGDRIPLGYATNRGMGAVAVRRVRFSGRDLPPPLDTLGGCELEGGNLGHLPPALRRDLTRAWQDWLGRQSGGGS
jgi:CRISPR/Cas system CSM-associated protein Csm3 (group 7 of RAMP superfamily)